MDKTKLTILIIEDDLIIAENLKENLIELGFLNIHAVHSYKQAQDIREKILPDLFLVDIGLNDSEKDGIDIMLDIFFNTTKPIIYLTSYSDRAIRAKAKQTKPAAYLIKTVSKSQLDVAIDFAVTNADSNHILNHEAVVEHHCPFVTGPGYFFIKGKEMYHKVVKSDIICLKADGTYTDIITTNKVHKYYMNLHKLLELMKYEDIIRCHRSYAINMKYITGFDEETIYLQANNEMFHAPLSKSFKDDIMGRLPKL